MRRKRRFIEEFGDGFAGEGGSRNLFYDDAGTRGFPEGNNNDMTRFEF